MSQNNLLTASCEVHAKKIKIKEEGERRHVRFLCLFSFFDRRKEKKERRFRLKPGKINKQERARCCPKKAVKEI